MTPYTTEQIAAWDRQYVWHPFTQHSIWNTQPPVVIVSGEREYLIDSLGNRYIDGNSSIWCNVHGHNHPVINRAISEQMSRIAHSTLLGLTAPAPVLLAKRLVELAPEGLSKVFFSDDGSTSVEVACKMAFGYWHHTGRPQRSEFIALKNAYHGDTLGAVSVGGIELFHRMYRPLLFKTHFAPSPYCYRCELHCSPESCEMACASGVERILKDHPDRIAALIVEPLMQCAAGMIQAPGGYLARLRRICDENDVLLIADEVATGFGRTGRMFACEQESVRPDLLCLSKGLAGGYLPLAATLATRRIYDAFLGEIDAGRTFYHGHTFTGNTLGCAAALACLDVFDHEQVMNRLPAKIEIMRNHLDRIAKQDFVGEVRQVGMLAGIEIVKSRHTRESYAYREQVGARICSAALKYGVIIRPLADVIVLVPPLCITDENLDHLMTTAGRCIGEVMDHGQAGVIDGLE